MKPYTPDPKRAAAIKKVWADPVKAAKLRKNTEKLRQHNEGLFRKKTT